MSVPEFLKEKILEEYGEKIGNKILDGYTKKRKTTLRVNTLKTNINEIKEVLQSNHILYKEVKWNNEALILENASESEIRSLNIYENGEIYLQSLSSMIPAIIVNPKEGETILDMAAAPGGKTTQMVAISNNKALITACEKNKIRADRLKYNIEKQGARVNLMVEDARKLSEFFSFDKILLDAPCSGSGTLNIDDKNLEKYFTEELINRSIKTQKELLTKASKIIKQGGEITYSTCSILKEENEKVLEEIIKKEKLEIIPINIEGLGEIPLLPVTMEGTICVCPNELYEGFFVARLKKK